MTKYSFLYELDQLLSELEAKERKEILEDYEEHFAFAKRADKSDEEVLALVGTPKEIAADLLGSKIEEKPMSLHSQANKEALEAQAKELEAQAKALEEKLAEQAKKLEEQAEALEEKIDAQQEKKPAESLLDSAGSLMGAIVDQAGVLVDEVSDTISGVVSKATFENAVESGTLTSEIVDVTGVTKIIINAENQKVDIKKTTYPTARVRLTKGILAVKVEGDTLYIDAREVRRKVGFISLSLKIEFPELKVELPEAIYDLIQAKTSNAKIEIENFNTELLDLKSSNGKLEVATLEAKALKLKTTNGKVEVKNATGEIKAETLHGKIELREVAGNVSARTSNAKVELKGITGDVDAVTSNGKIELQGITGKIDAVTSNGKIEWHSDAIAQDANLKTSNAKIEVKLMNKPEDAKFELSTTHASTLLFGTNRNYDVFGAGTHQVKLVTSNAKIEVLEALEKTD
ncbi:MAG: DUF4097 family beta strand repeat-containing protein [Turicibacter sp.]|nr:DUF4097 family beta strand repeat-containing protein [Turicibacter sp.]